MRWYEKLYFKVVLGCAFPAWVYKLYVIWFAPLSAGIQIWNFLHRNFSAIFIVKNWKIFPIIWVELATTKRKLRSLIPKFHLFNVLLKSRFRCWSRISRLRIWLNRQEKILRGISCPVCFIEWVSEGNYDHLVLVTILIFNF